MPDVRGTRWRLVKAVVDGKKGSVIEPFRTIK
jgi:hypothetical protein